jgi:hypothetical protein
MTDAVLTRIRDMVQEDVAGRGLRTDPVTNLITACPGDFAAACHSLAETPNAAVAVVTGFLIPHAEPPAAETDGPPGALFLARALVPLGIRIALVTDPFCRRALEAGLAACDLQARVPVLDGQDGRLRDGFTHLVALERVGPTHTLESLRTQPSSTPAVVAAFEQEVPPEHRGRCFTMRGLDVTEAMCPVHRRFEDAAHRPGVTIGIGDGGNEIGMGKIPWDVIRRNIPRGDRIACRVATDHLIVAGVSNWGAYGLAAGVRLLRGRTDDADLFDPERERRLLEIMVERGPLVDGVSGRPSVGVDGLPFERYAEPLRWLHALVQSPPPG